MFAGTHEAARPTTFDTALAGARILTGFVLLRAFLDSWNAGRVRGLGRMGKRKPLVRGNPWLR
ncbi:hypothetical protein [Streptomyces sp. NPDC051561]|uniref:hypothetical protein n=1 Tax=Streptomyces sp. NPDC051561 TaxID=3365658 RepID=UPI0037A554B8